MYIYIILHNMIVENKVDSIINWNDDDDETESSFLVSRGYTHDF